MFKTGDLIFYSSTGVCKVVAVGPPDIKGMSRNVDYYTLEPLSESHREMIYVPVNSKAFMRQVLSRREVMDFIEQVKGIKPVYPRGRNPKAIRDFYSGLINSCKSENLLQVIVSLTVKKRENRSLNKQLNRTQASFLRRAQEIIFGEFSLVLDKTQEEVRDMIESNIARRAY